VEVEGNQKKKKCMKLDWNFKRGGGRGVLKKSFHEQGSDFFRNGTLLACVYQ